MTQILAADDAFTEGTPNYGTYLTNYIRFNPWESLGAAPSIGGYTIRNNGIPDLHNGYFGIPNAQSTNAAFKNNVALSSGSTPRVFSACLWRPYVSNDSTASIAFVPHRIVGNPTTASFSYAGVCVRASGSPTEDVTPTGDARLFDGDSYWFMLVNDATSGTKWLLLRVKAGAVTVLDSIAETAVAWGFTNEISLSVDDTAGNPVLTATAKYYTSHFNSYPVLQDGTPATRTIFTYTDSNVNKITASGRCGFGAAQEHQQGSSSLRTHTLIPWFQIYDIGTASVVHRDEWQRASVWLGQFNANDTIGTGSIGLMSAFNGDVSGIASPYLFRDSGNNRVKTTALGGTQTVSTRPATNSYTQERSCVFNLANPTTTPTVACGLIMRANWPTSGVVAVRGYRFIVQNANGVWSARIERIGNGGASVVMVQNTNIGSFGLALNSDFTLSFAVSNSGGTNETNGTPLLVAKINGTIPAWSLASDPQGGITINATNTILHTQGTSLGLLSGNVQGIYSSAGASCEVRFDTWTDVVAAAQGIADDAMVGVTTASETDGATGTLVLPYDWPVEEERVWRIAEHRFDSRHMARMAWDGTPRRRWRISAHAITSDERDDLKTFYDDHRGVEIPFTWVCPAGDSITAHFVDDNLGLTLKAPGVYGFDFTIEELRA